MNACSRTASAWRLDLLIIILLAPLPTLAARFAGGTGDPNDPYQIATAAQLTSIGADPTLLNKHYVLLNDIDLDPNLPGNRVFNQAVIGRVGERLGEFKGRFSGAGHIIRNLVIVSESEYPVGLFSDVGRGAEVEQLGIENARISGVDAVGTLAGENGGRIIACYATGIVKCLPRPRDSTDKTVPEADEGYDQMMRQLRKIYGDRYMKQLFDPNDRVEIPVRAGGLVAYNGRRIESCYAQVAVEGAAEDPNAIDAGALAGANSGSIFASYSAGRVATGSGGLVGNNTYTATGPTPLKGYVSLSFWDAQASGCATSAAGTSRTTAQMRDPQSFRGWDYQGHWTIDDGADYPRLRWEKRAAAPMPAFGAYADGTGKLGDPFVIRKAEELATIGRFRTTWDSHFVLANDVDMSAIDPNDLLCIGTLYLPFTGTFDGRGRTIHNFTFRPKDEGRAGLFGLVGHRRLDQLPRVGLIENVKVQHGSVTGSTRVGLLVAENWGTIRACHVHGSVTGTRSYAGGLVGFSAGRIDTCTSSGMVQGSDDVGGLVGSSFGKNDAIENCSSSCTVVGRKPVGGLTGYAGGSVRNSYASGSVRGDSDVGGLIGNATARVWACYATGDVTGDEDVGGLAGESLVSTVACYASGTVHGGTGVGGLVGHNSGGIVACYSTGKVTGDKAFGGLIGSQRFMRIGDWRVGADRLCFWDRQTSGIATSDGGLGRTTAQLMQAVTFEGWGINDTWVLREGHDYPRLAWQNPPGEPIRDDPQRYAGGTGQPNDPFQIHTIAQLCAIGNHPGDFGSHFTLLQDLDCADLDPNAFTPIGFEGLPFLGSFDGRDHTISRLMIARPREDYVALFGHAGSLDDSSKTSATRLANLHLRQITVHGQDQVAALAGMLGAGAIDNCTVTGKIKGQGAVGGLVGFSSGSVARCTVNAEVLADSLTGVLIGSNAGTVESCAATGTLTGKSRLGGLIGINAGDSVDARDPNTGDATARVSRSRADCTVAGDDRIGGFIGYCTRNSRIESCYARGTIKGQKSVGGLLGALSQSNVTNSYAATVVSGTERTGGFVGRNYDHARRRREGYIPGVISACFWDAPLSGLERGIGDSPDPASLTGLPTDQMQTPTPFRNAGWDLEKTWTIPLTPNYPRLRWEDQ